MPSDPQKQELSPDSSWISLEIAGQQEEGAAQLPVTLKKVAGRVATLEVSNAWRLMKWETLQGQQGFMHLTPREGGEPKVLEGTVVWARLGGVEKRRLHLGLELAHPDPPLTRLLEAYLTQTPKDMKELWNRWDEVHATPAGAPLGRKLYLAGLGLILVGMILQLAGPKAIRIIGWVLWFLGSLGVIARYVGPLKSTD